MRPLKMSKTVLFMIALLTVAGQMVRAASRPASDCTPVRLADISAVPAEGGSSSHHPDRRVLARERSSAQELIKNEKEPTGYP